MGTHLQGDADLVNVHGLARVLCLPVRWLKVEAERGRLPCLRVGRHMRFSVEAVERVLLERARKGESEVPR